MLSGTKKYCDCVGTAEIPLPILRHNRRRKLFSVPRVVCSQSPQAPSRVGAWLRRGCKAPPPHAPPPLLVHSSVHGHALNQPEELLCLQNNPAKTSQFMSNCHGFYHQTSSLLAATMPCTTGERRLRLGSRAERGGGGISTTS